MVRVLTGEFGKVSRGCFEGHKASKSFSRDASGEQGRFFLWGRMLMQVWNRELILLHLKDWCRHWWAVQVCTASGKPSECLQSPPTKELRRDRTFIVHTADFLWSLSFITSQSCLATPVHTHIHTHTHAHTHTYTHSCNKSYCHSWLWDFSHRPAYGWKHSRRFTSIQQNCSVCRNTSALYTYSGACAEVY